MRCLALMHLEKKVATICGDGSCAVHCPSFMPFNLRLENADGSDCDLRAKNLDQFYHWCAARPLTLERNDAKDFLIRHGYQEAKTDRERAEIALRCHGLCLTDAFWIREIEENIRFNQINLFDSQLSDEYVDIVLRDRGMIAKNLGLMDEASALAETNTPNVWARREDGYWLLKDGAPDEVAAEWTASQIARCFDVDQVLYEPMTYQGRRVSRSKLVTSKEWSIVFAGDMGEYLRNEGKSLWELVSSQDEYGFHMMNIIDYLIGNTDRHWRNWGFWVSNEDNQPGKLFPLMDFNRSFRAYDTLEGDQCFPLKGKMTQRAAAVWGVQKIGLNQNKALPKDLPSLFFDLNRLCQTRMDVMFQARLDVLRRAARR